MQSRYGGPSAQGQRYRDTAIAGGAATGVSAGVYAAGRGMRNQGRFQQQRGSERFSAAIDRINAAREGVDAKHLRPNGEVDLRTKAGREIKSARAEQNLARNQRKAGFKLVGASSKVRRAGKVGMSLGAVAALGGGIGNEIARSRKPKAAPSNVVPIERGQELMDLRPKGAPLGHGKFAEDESGKFKRVRTPGQKTHDSWANSGKSGPDWQRDEDKRKLVEEYDRQQREAENVGQPHLYDGAARYKPLKMYQGRI